MVSEITTTAPQLVPTQSVGVGLRSGRCIKEWRVNYPYDATIQIHLHVQTILRHESVGKGDELNRLIADVLQTGHGRAARSSETVQLV